MSKITKREFICIVCPMGCQLSVEAIEGEEIIVNGSKCKRGDVYAIQEMTDPRRHITSTVRVHNGFLNLVPVKTDTEIPKDKIFDVMKEINSIELEAPIKIGTIIIENVANTGSNIVTTRDIEKMDTDSDYTHLSLIHI